MNSAQQFKVLSRLWPLPAIFNGLSLHVVGHCVFLKPFDPVLPTVLDLLWHMQRRIPICLLHLNNFFLFILFYLRFQRLYFCKLFSFCLSYGIFDLFVDALLDTDKHVLFNCFNFLIVCHNFDHNLGCPVFNRIEQSLEVCFAFSNQHLWHVFRLDLTYREYGRNVYSLRVFFFFE